MELRKNVENKKKLFSLNKLYQQKCKGKNSDTGIMITL